MGHCNANIWVMMTEDSTDDALSRIKLFFGHRLEEMMKVFVGPSERRHCKVVHH